MALELGVGRRTWPLREYTVDIHAPRDLVYDIVAQPYLGRPTRAIREKVRVLERGSDMVLAEHFTAVGDHLTATTVETVRFTRPERVDFRLVRGPVPHVTESFILSEHGGDTRLDYRGEIGTDLGVLGQHWGRLVARHWEAAVAAALSSITKEAEHRAAQR
jgi:hypothetical protein